MLEFQLVLRLADDLGPVSVIVRYKHLIALIKLLGLSLRACCTATHHTASKAATAAGCTCCANVVPVKLNGVDSSLVTQINGKELTCITGLGNPAGLEILIKSLCGSIVLKG